QEMYRHHGAEQGDKLMREALGYGGDGKKLKERRYRPDDFNLGELFAETFGWNEFQACRNRGRLGSQGLEAAGATPPAALASITGQIVYSAIMDAYQKEEFIFTRIIPEKQSQFIDQEKVAGITQQGDQDLVVPEGQDFPLVGVGQTWISWPEALKRGRRVALTREAIFRDRTGVLLDRCAAVGEWLGVNREKRAIDCVIDENAGAVNQPTGHTYRWRDTYIRSYGDNSGAHTWDNLQAANDLTGGDWTKVDAAEQLLNQQVDPDTGEPLMSDYNYLICTKQLEKTALRILNATEIRVATPGFATTGAPTQTNVANPYAGKFQVLSSRLLRMRLAAATTWFFGNPGRAFIYKTIFPMATLEAPSNSVDEFKT